MALLGRGRKDSSEALAVLERTGNGGLVRAPQVATRSLGWTSPGAPAVAEWSAEQAVRVAYYANVYVWACVRAIATDIAALPFRVGADPTKPLDFDVRDPLAQLLGPPPGGPNKGTSPSRFWAWTIAQRLVTGRWAWEIEMQRTQVAALWPLTSSHLQPLTSDGGADYFTGYEYRVQGGQVRKLKPEQVLYDWVPSLTDWRQPESPLQAARLPISVAVMQDRYDVAFLKNDARPAAVVVHEAFETTVGRDAWRRQFTDTHQGPDNAGKVAFVETGEDGASPKDALFVQTLGLSQKDGEFIARYEGTIRSILVALGVPMSRLGDSSKRTFSNADQETSNYWRNTLLPIIGEMAEAVNIKLAPRLTKNVGWFDLSGISALQEDKATPKVQPAPVNVYVRERIVTPNEGRAMLGLAPLAGGDELLPAASAVPAKGALPAAGDSALGAGTGAGSVEERATARGIAEMVQKIYLGVDVLLTADEARGILNRVGAGLEGPMPPKPAPPPNPFAPVALPAAPAAAGELPPANPSEGRSAQRAPETAAQAKARRERLQREMDARVRDLEKVWQRSFQKLLDKQRDAVLSRLEGKRGRQMMRDAAPDASQLFDVTHWQDETAQLVDGLYEQVAMVSGTAQVAAIGGDFKATDSWVRSMIQRRTAMLSPQVTSTTYDAIKAQLADGAQAGEGIPELAKRIRGLFDQTYANRAETVARTEVVSAYNGTAQGFARENDAIGGIEWIATLDNRTRLSHAALDGTIIVKGQAFNVDGVSLLFPGDPGQGAPNPGSAIINCRCTIAPVLRQDMPPELGGTGPGSARPSMGDIGTDKVESDGEDSAAAFLQGGHWDPERSALHDKIIGDVLDGYSPTGEKRMMMMGGGGGAGKGTFLKAHPDVAPRGAATIDPDAIKGMLPEHGQRDDWARYLHEESSYLSARVMKAAQERDLSIVLDGVGNGSLAKLTAKIKQAQAAGYTVSGNYITVPTQQAVDQAMARAAKIGRVVPTDALEKAHAGVSKVFPDAAPLFDNAVLYDTRVLGEAVKVAEVEQGGTLRILDPDLWAQFLAKAKG